MCFSEISGDNSMSAMVWATLRVFRYDLAVKLRVFEAESRMSFAGSDIFRREVSSFVLRDELYFFDGLRENWALMAFLMSDFARLCSEFGLEEVFKIVEVSTLDTDT